MLQKKGYKLYATGGSSHFLTENGVENTRVYWPSEEGKPQALDMLHRKEIDMVVNIPKNLTAGGVGQWIQDPSCRYRPECALDYQCSSGKCVYQCFLYHDDKRYRYQKLVGNTSY